MRLRLSPASPIDRALEGDPQALRLCLDRIVPPRRERPISFAMPKIGSAKDAAGAMAALIAAVADGSITAGEAEGVTRLVDAYVPRHRAPPGRSCGPRQLDNALRDPAARAKSPVDDVDL
jgi:hypothetical protein